MQLSLPNYLLKKEETKRTKSALHSFISIGPHSDKVTSLHQKTTWGKNSAFEWIEKKNAKWIALNLNWSRGCTLYHRAEEIVGVLQEKMIHAVEGMIGNLETFLMLMIINISIHILVIT